MCGRFEIHSALEIIAKLFQAGSFGFDIKPNYNVASTHDIAIVRENGERAQRLPVGISAVLGQECRSRLPLALYGGYHTFRIVLSPLR